MAISDDDLDACFDTDDFAVPAIFATSGGNVTVNGYFTDATESVGMLSGEMEANDASFACKTSDVTAVKNENTVTIGGTAYTVKRKQKLGTGVTLFYLKT